jgi:hypothetical protein
VLKYCSKAIVNSTATSSNTCQAETPNSLDPRDIFTTGHNCNPDFSKGQNCIQIFLNLYLFDSSNCNNFTCNHENIAEH